MMKKCLLLVMMLHVLGAMSPNTAWSALVNVNCTAIDRPEITGAAAIGEDGDLWNQYAGPRSSTNIGKKSNLVDVDGTATGISFEVTGATVAYPVDNPGGPELFRGYQTITGPATATITFDGLTPNATYDLYIYSSVNLPSNYYGQFAKFTFGGVTKQPTPGSSLTYVENENYVIISAAADAFGVLSGTMAVGDGNTTPGPWACFNGVQLVVPEPTTLGLVFLGTLFLRRKK